MLKGLFRHNACKQFSPFLVIQHDPVPHPSSAHVWRSRQSFLRSPDSYLNFRFLSRLIFDLIINKSIAQTSASSSEGLLSVEGTND